MGSLWRRVAHARSFPFVASHSGIPTSFTAYNPMKFVVLVAMAVLPFRTEAVFPQIIKDSDMERDRLKSATKQFGAIEARLRPIFRD